jgi:glycosyltransferase involved in cell wall biosynthesis
MSATGQGSAPLAGAAGQRPRRVLMIAYHFPPLAGSSGIQRTLRFVQQLPAHGWEPLVLSAHPRAYERTSDDLLADVPLGTVVRRAQAFDTARHFAMTGRYIASMARPDRWQSWRFDAVRQGMRMIREFRPQAIWSTYPIATAHVIGAELQRRSGLPWIADFRDPMAQEGYPKDPLTWQAFHRIETVAIERAQAAVFTTPSAAREYRERYPHAADRIRLIENGYDESSFAAAETADPSPAPLTNGAVTLLHSGIVYPSERDPSALIEALGRLARRGVFPPGTLRVRFRAAVHDDLLQRLASQHGAADLIETLPPVPYREALSEMRRADALLVMQSAGCNAQIPAKVYEYLRARKPALVLTDPAGDTAGVMRDAGLADIARLDDSADIERALEVFVGGVRAGTARLPTPEAVQRASREHKSQELAELLARL